MPERKAASLELMAQKAIGLGHSPIVSRQLAEQLQLLLRDDLDACEEQLGSEEAQTAVCRRFFLQPVRYIEIVAARLPIEAVFSAMNAPDHRYWLGRLVAAFGKVAVKSMVLGAHLHHVQLARRWRGHALWLVRMAHHWCDHPAVRLHLAPLEDRVRSRRATRAERRLWQALEVPVRPDKPYSDGLRGRPSTSLRDAYAAERRTTMRAKSYLSELYAEVEAIFGLLDVQPEGLRRALRKHRRESTVWVELPAGFSDTPVGKALAPLDPLPIHLSPYAASRIALSRCPDRP